MGVPPLIEGLAFDALIADKAFDSNAIIAELDANGTEVVISQHPRRAKPLAIGMVSMAPASVQTRAAVEAVPRADPAEYPQSYGARASLKLNA